MTEKPVCKCSMNDDDGLVYNIDKIYTQQSSCCKTDTKFISNSSDYENTHKININNVSAILYTSKLINILFPISSNINFKKLQFLISTDIPLRNSSLLI